VSDTLKILDTNFAFIPTDKGLNYIICKEFKEVFFDIFEINCGGNKIIAEKVDDLSGDPVLKITTEYNNNLYNSLYVLKEGDDNIVFNVNSLDNGRRVFAKEKQILESVAEEENLPDPEPIVEETYITSESASVDIERYKADAIRVINENHSNKKQKIEQLSESLTNLIDERLSELKSSSITDIKSLKSDILKSFDERVSQVEIISDKAVAEANSIRESIEATAELYTNIVTANADEKTKQLQDLKEGVVYDVNTKIAELQTELVNQETQVNNAFQSIQTFIDESKKQLLEQKTTNITDVEHICNESKQVISENLKRAESLVSNKIGKLQSTADKKINDITTLVENRISLFDNRIADINSAIERAENSLQEQISQGLNNILTEAKSHSSILEDKKIEIEELVSKTANELSVLGTGIVEAVEKKVKDFNLVAIKREDLNSLKKQLETRLENESANLKKYVAGYGGGGSVAAQYAKGGTVNGSLNVNGQILSGGVDISTLFSGGGGGVSGDYLPLSGGTLTGNLNLNYNNLLLGGSSGLAWNQLNIQDGVAGAGASMQPNLVAIGQNEYSVNITSSEFTIGNSDSGKSAGLQLNTQQVASSVTYYTPAVGGALITDQSVWPNANSIGWADAMFYRDSAANTIAQRNSTNPQTFRVYNTYITASRYERGFCAWNSNVFQIGTEKLGSGLSARAMSFVTDGVERMNIAAAGGITVTSPLSTNQDIEITDATKGIILRTPSNFRYRVTVSDAGELTTTLL
jgi:hypothetical protein